MYVIGGKLFVFSVTAATAAAGTITAAGARIGTAYALFAAFLGFVNIGTRKGNNQQHNCNNNIVFHSDTPFFYLPFLIKFK